MIDTETSCEDAGATPILMPQVLSGTPRGPRPNGLRPKGLKLKARRLRQVGDWPQAGLDKAHDFRQTPASTLPVIYVSVPVCGGTGYEKTLL